jgi:hypothetical protein
MIVVSYASALRAMGHAATSPERRLLTALGIGLVLAALPFLVRGTINIAKGDDDAPSPRRWSLVLAVSFMVASVIATQPGVPDQWRLGMLVFSSTISFTLAFGYVAWRLLRMPSDALSTGRQLAAFGFGAYALKQLWNVQAFVNAGAPDPAASAIAENIVLIMVAMGSIALLFDRLGQRDRQIDMQILALAAEDRVRLDLEFHQSVARGPALHARTALRLQPQHLAVRHAGRNDHVERAPVAHLHALARTADGVQEIDLHVQPDVASAHAPKTGAPARPG